MKITVKYFAALREIVGKKEDLLEFDEDLTVENLLGALSNKYGKEFQEYIYDEEGRLRENLQFLIDGKSISTTKGIKTRLHDSSQFVIIPPVGGGYID